MKIIEGYLTRVIYITKIKNIIIRKEIDI